MDAKTRQSLDNLGRAVRRLEEALDRSPADDLVVDATIQRFELSIELTWKTLKRVLEHDGIQSDAPRTALERAYAAGWIHEEDLWLQMLRDRNLTSHVYDEAMARAMVERIRAYAPLLRSCFEDLRRRAGEA